jgi:hypothetical protein
MTSKWDGILRCRTFNVWPAKTTSALPPLDIDYGAASPVCVHTFVHAWAPKSKPELNLIEETELGPRLWGGEQPGLNRIRDSILIGIGEQVQLAQPNPRPAHRGELDVQLSFELNEDPPDPLVEALRTRAYEIVALLNLRLRDFVTPTMPFQIRKILPNNEFEAEFPVKVEVQPRHTLGDETVGEFLMGIAHFLSDPSYGEKYRIALELYAAHFTEQQIRVRFILLVIAMEALSEKTYKHHVALDLLDRWKGELKAEKAKYEEPDEEFYSLDDLYREIKWRGESSLGDGIRRLFAALPGHSEEQRADLQRRVMAVYRKRSTLVHDGYVPVNELPGLEREARELLELLFISAIDRSKAGDARYKLVSREPAESAQEPSEIDAAVPAADTRREGT